ncbi:MAG: Fic family protein [Cyanobacteria bacterium]|nr:Fic family protein [Cyanobacteriota bacterium]
MESNLNQRQIYILEVLGEKLSVSIAELRAAVTDVSQKTLVRDLNFLQEQGLVKREGQAKATSYSLLPLYRLTKVIDKQTYFDIELDLRKIQQRFEHSIFNDLQESSEKIFTQSESKHIDELTKKYQLSKSELSQGLIKKEFERLTIELAWKSSKIEGNTYSLLDTEALLKTGILNPNHSQEEAQMLLNHKQVLDYLLENSSTYKKLSLSNLIDLHNLVIDKLAIDQNIRKKLVGITGTSYRPLENEFQIKEALEKTCVLINQEGTVIAKALYSSVLFPYIQAFEDGNRRTARMATNAILMAYDYCPLSYRSIDIQDYKKSILLFYEQNNLRYLKELVIEQYEFAVNNYFC